MRFIGLSILMFVASGLLPGCGKPTPDPKTAEPNGPVRVEAPANQETGQESVATVNAADVPKTQEAPPAEPSGRIERELGADVVDTIRNADEVTVARLTIIGAAVAEENWLKSDDRIGGYPVADPLKAVTKEQARQLAELILDESPYDHTRERRCKNDKIFGARFTKGADRVEFWLGMNCEQAMFVYLKSGQPTFWYSLFIGQPAKDVVAIVAQAQGRPEYLVGIGR